MTPRRDTQPLADKTMPRPVALLGGLLSAALVSGALYLALVRRDAIVIDLSQLSQMIFCL